MAIKERLPGGVQPNSYRIMLRIACQIPAMENSGVLTGTARTGSDPFLTLAVAVFIPFRQTSYEPGICPQNEQLLALG